MNQGDPVNLVGSWNIFTWTLTYHVAHKQGNGQVAQVPWNGVKKYFGFSKHWHSLH
jgi:hypothetical protein